MSGHHTRMRFCGIDVSARPDNQQLCTLHERKGAEGVELVATFYAPGTIEEVARTIQGFGRGEAVVGIDAPSGRRLGLLGPHAPARATLGLPDGRYERMRVCDARALPPRPAAVPGAGRRGRGAGLDGGRLRPVRGARAARPLRPRARRRRARGRRRRARRSAPAASSRPTRTRSSARCSATARRPSARPGAASSGSRRSSCKGIYDDDGGLWHRTLDEIDACAAAYAAYALCVGLGTWVGDPAEGVMVIPTARLLERYTKLPAPARSGLA